MVPFFNFSISFLCDLETLSLRGANCGVRTLLRKPHGTAAVKSSALELP